MFLCSLCTGVMKKPLICRINHIREVLFSAGSLPWGATSQSHMVTLELCSLPMARAEDLLSCSSQALAGFSISWSILGQEEPLPRASFGHAWWRSQFLTQLSGIIPCEDPCISQLRKSLWEGLSSAELQCKAPEHRGSHRLGRELGAWWLLVAQEGAGSRSQAEWHSQEGTCLAAVSKE